jgi:hypothetical protein
MFRVKKAWIDELREIIMEMRKLGRSGLEIAPLVLGGNVFGWTADEPTSFAQTLCTRQARQTPIAQMARLSPATAA